MEGYHLYFMDRFSGHIDHRRDFVADSDDEAMAIAQSWFDGSPMELWLGGRKLRRGEEQPLMPFVEGPAAQDEWASSAGAPLVRVRSNFPRCGSTLSCHFREECAQWPGSSAGRKP